MRDIGFSVLESKANFLFAMYPGVEGVWLYEQLKRRGILVRHFQKPRIHPYIRITIGTRQEMETFVETLKEIIWEEGK